MSKAEVLIPAIVICLKGISITVVGALFKIQHWPYGSEITTLGNCVIIFGIVIAVILFLNLYFSKK